MVQNEAPYDPYIPSGSNGAQGNGQNGNQRTAALQAVSCTPDPLIPGDILSIKQSHPPGPVSAR